MPSNTTKTIFLVEILNGGHREAFMQLFAKALLELGHRVVCIKPDVKSVEEWLNVNCAAYRDKTGYYEVSFPKSYIDETRHWAKTKSYLYLWRYYKKHIDEAARKNNMPVDFVFFSCIDGFLINYLPYQLTDIVFPYPWACLYFHPNHLRMHKGIFDQPAGLSDVDYVLRSKKCVAVTIHDEGVVEGFSKRLGGKPVILFPETADITAPDPEYYIAREIREKAKGRIVSGMIGLEPYKGSYEFMKLAKAADPSKYFFAFCGVFTESMFSFFNNDAYAAEFREFRDNLPENCYWNTGFLNEGKEYNSVFSAFDIIFLVYRNFYSSSNRLTKAANLHRLVMSKSQYCVGEDVMRYKLGETVDTADPASMVQALEKLGKRIRENDLPREEWKVYAHKHSEAILKEKFREIISLIP